MALNTTVVAYRIIKQLAALITMAFAFAAGSEWRSAIEKLLQDNVEIDEKNIFAYPIIVTIIAVLVTITVESVSLKFLNTAEMKKAKELEKIRRTEAHDTEDEE